LIDPSKRKEEKIDAMAGDALVKSGLFAWRLARSEQEEYSTLPA
jgi:hypothetical protein